MAAEFYSLRGKIKLKNYAVRILQNVKDKQFNKVIYLFKVGISLYPSLQCLLYFSPTDIDLIPDAGDIESYNDYEEESFNDKYSKDGLEDKIAVVYVSCLLELAKTNILLICESSKTEVSIKTIKRGSAMVLK